MSEESYAGSAFHSHVFLGEGHEASERKTWAVIILCSAMMLAEIVGGWLFGSIALIADGLHMSTHAGALLLAAVAYTFARRYADDPRFTFGTGKFGDLAGFSSALILAMIALLIGYEAVCRLFAPVHDPFRRGDPDRRTRACRQCRQRLAAERRRSRASARPWSRAWHDHTHDHDESKRIATRNGEIVLEVFEDGVPPRFRLHAETGLRLAAQNASVETVRPDGARQLFAFVDRGDFLEFGRRNSRAARLRRQCDDQWREPCRRLRRACARRRRRRARQQSARGVSPRDRRCGGLGDGDRRPRARARAFGWMWMDPVAGIIGAFVIASWALSLIRDTSAILLDMNPDRRMANHLRQAIESEGDRIADLHLWRLGPGHFGAIVSIVTPSARSEADYRARLARFRSLSHLTIEVKRAA